MHKIFKKIYNSLTKNKILFEKINYICHNESTRKRERYKSIRFVIGNRREERDGNS